MEGDKVPETFNSFNKRTNHFFNTCQEQLVLAYLKILMNREYRADICTKTKPTANEWNYEAEWKADI